MDSTEKQLGKGNSGEKKKKTHPGLKCGQNSIQKFQNMLVKYCILTSAHSHQENILENMS